MTLSISCASCVGVLPTATTSLTKGVEIFPSGRTGTSALSSGLRSTLILRVSPGPMMYSPEVEEKEEEEEDEEADGGLPAGRSAGALTTPGPGTDRKSVV